MICCAVADVASDDQPLLYRLRGFLDADVTLAAGSDAPFGGYDPWASMAAAVSRGTRDGACIGEDESLTPEQALDLYLRAPESLSERRRITLGSAADLCLLDRPWAHAREALSSAYVRATIIQGELQGDTA